MEDLVALYGREILQSDKMAQEEKYPHHGKKSCFCHCKFVNEILIVFQKNFRKCGKSLFCDYKNRKKTTCINKTARKFNIRERQNSRLKKSA